MTATPRFLIIGAGLAGLACARRLTESGVSCTVLEASDGVGGRARTDRVGGFLLDRGFQVFLTGYPEARRMVDYAALDLKPFHPGALVRYGGRFHLFSDPLRRPQDLLSTVLNPIGSLGDKFRLLRLRRDALQQKLCPSTGGPDRPTREVLQAYGFSDALVMRFFQPFLSGVFLESMLNTPCWIFEHVWAAFCRGDTALPHDGMGAVARQLATALPPGTIRLNQAVQGIEGSRVLLASGEPLAYDGLVIATDDKTAAHLRGEPLLLTRARESLTLYFDAQAPPQRGPWLILNGEGEGLIRTVCVLSEAAPSYAPAGRALISVGLTDQGATSTEDLPQVTRTVLRDWFGSQVDQWHHLRTDRVSRALPPVDLLPSGKSPALSRVAPGLYLCGDYRESGTLDGALLSGRKAAEAVLADYHTSIPAH